MSTNDEAIEFTRLVTHNSIMQHALRHIISVTQMMEAEKDAAKAIREMAQVALQEPPTIDELRRKANQRDN